MNATIRDAAALRPDSTHPYQERRMRYFQMLCNRASNFSKSLIQAENLKISPRKQVRFQKFEFIPANKKYRYRKRNAR
jgi:hypothetical protein